MKIMTDMQILSGAVSNVDRTGLTHPDGRNIVAFRVDNHPVYFHHTVDLNEGETVTLVSTPKHDSTKVLALRNENTQTEYIADVRFRALIALAVFLVGVLTVKIWIGFAFMIWAVALLVRAKAYQDAIGLLHATPPKAPEKIQATGNGKAEQVESAPVITVRDDTDIRVMRHFDAAPEDVFDAWLDPATAGLWLFATPGGKMVEIDIDPEIGGKYTITELRNGARVEHHGTYLELDRPRRLIFTLVVPPAAPDHSRVIVDIAPYDGGDGCVLTLTHENVALEHADRTEKGWSDILDRLATTLTGQRIH